jgi:hypothetical protein
LTANHAKYANGKTDFVFAYLVYIAVKFFLKKSGVALVLWTTKVGACELKLHAMNNELEPKVRWKRYDQNFKRSAVERWLGSGKSADRTAGDLGINAQTLKICKQQLAVLPPGAKVQHIVEAWKAEHRRLR